MRTFLSIIMLSLILTQVGQAQESDSTGSFGVSINSSLNGELYPIRIVPSVTYSKGNSQFELGVGAHPVFDDQTIISGELNYKYYPNGAMNKFRMYLLANLSYVYNPRETFYPTTYNYLFLNGGYGFEIAVIKGLYLGTNVSLGAFTNNTRSENPYAGYQEVDLFDEVGMNLGFQFNLGYRF